ncbi:MAG: hypothetical protein AB7W44_18750, partial [Pyrinomonadaceae bacterium]
MDTANLSFAHVAISLFGSLFSVGLALMVGYRIVPAFKAHKGQLAVHSNPNAVQYTKITHPGRLFPTEIAGLDGNVIRYRDGSFGKAYVFEPANSLYVDGNVTEQRIEELKTILKFEKP